MGWLKSYWIELVLVGVLVAAVGFFGYLGYGLIQAQATPEEFSGEDALAAAATQMEFGPRIVGTESSIQVQDWLISEFQSAGWYPARQPFILPVPAENMPPNTVFTSTETSSVPMVQGMNIIAVNDESTETNRPVGWIVTRYDTRLWADADPDPAQRQMPVPGANGGASGPALVVEMAHTVKKAATGHKLCIVVLDGEANRGLPGWSELTGIDYYLQGLTGFLSQCQDPRFAVVLDLVGGADQQIYMEQGSDPSLADAIWQFADQLGHSDVIIAESKWEIPGPHEALSANQIPTVTLIDYDYPQRTTREDTIDKLSADSFTSIGETLTAWLEAQAPFTPQN